MLQFNNLCRYNKVESCRAVTVNGTSIDLDPSPSRVAQVVVPTFFPNQVESVVNTRSQRGDSVGGLYKLNPVDP